mgnify:CR=1 FL=1
MKDLGWVNGWNDTPELVKKCRELKHETVGWDNATIKNHGYDTVTKCEICDYIFHCDSSD